MCPKVSYIGLYFGNIPRFDYCIRMYYFPRPNVWGVSTSRSPRARCGVVASY